MVMPPGSGSPGPLTGAVLAVLKVARDLDAEITATKLAKLLYLADLQAIEAGGTPFTGATWRWDHDGPYDHALTRAEEYLVAGDLVEPYDDWILDPASRPLTLTVDIGDPLDSDDMEWIRTVVRMYGDKSADGLKYLADETAPVIEARTGDERGGLLNLHLARRHKQYTDLKERLKARRDTPSPRTCDPETAQGLIDEYLQMKDSIRRANEILLGDG